MTLPDAILDRAIRERREAIEERDRLRAALRDFIALLPPDRWALLRPETQATVSALEPAP